MGTKLGLMKIAHVCVKIEKEKRGTDHDRESRQILMIQMVQIN